MVFLSSLVIAPVCFFESFSFAAFAFVLARLASFLIFTLAESPGASLFASFASACGAANEFDRLKQKAVEMTTCSKNLFMIFIHSGAIYALGIAQPLVHVVSHSLHVQ